VRRIETAADLEIGLAELVRVDPRLGAIAGSAGPLPLRRRPGGFEGLAAIVTAQQISTAAAASIWVRLRTAVDPFTPEAFLESSDESLRTAGLSRPKISTLRGIASACADGLVWRT
jgi:DNA-3-methyladenine glycosylase II